MPEPETGLRSVRIFDWVLRLAAASVLAATGAALAARWWWLFELFSHFRLQYLVAALLLISFLLAQRRFLWCAALAACAALNAVPLAPYLPLGQPAIAADGAMTLMEVNVLARNRSYEKLLDIVGQEMPDMLLIVELSDFWADALRPLYARYPYHVLLPQPGPYGIALLSLFPIEKAARIELESTPAIDAFVQSPQGRLRVVGVHLRAPVTPALAAERNRQLDELAALRRTSAGPIVVVGDFNSTAFSPFFADWLEETGLRDGALGLGYGASWPAFLPIVGIPIDHCVVSPELRVASVRQLPAFGSDHYPMLIDLILEDPG